MKKLALLFTVLFCLNALIKAQEYDEKVYFSDAEYFFVQEFYIDALSDFLEVSKHGHEDNANLNYMIGVCYLNIPGQKEKSIEYFLKAEPSVSVDYKKSSLKEQYAPVDLYLFLGNAYRISEQFDKAIDAYNKYKAIVGDANSAELDYADMQIDACKNAKKLMENPLDIHIRNVGEPINNSYANFNPVVSGDGNTMVYMSRLPFYDAVLISEKIGGKWTEPRNITPELQSDGDQYVCAISFDGSQLLLSREEDMNSDIYISTMDDKGVWKKSTPLESINTRYWESHASFSKDGKTLYFASNRNDGKGGMDIFRATKLTDGTWGNIKNIGAPINTSMNEDVPFITEDGTKLYFSSQRKNTIGGYDIFVSELQEDGSWGEPQNIGYPLNTPDDNLFFFPHNNGTEPYFFRYLNDGYGDYDILTIGEEPVIEVPIAEQVETPEEIDTTMAEAPVEPIQEETIVEKLVEKVTPAVEKVVYEVKPIFFDFDKYTLSTESKQMLDNVARVMIDNPEANLVVSGHTDAFGSINYNIRLSKHRAEAAENYLASKGVEKTRIKLEAKNEGSPLVETDMTNKNSPKNRLNRRVEFKFSDLDANKAEVKYTFVIPAEYK